MDIFTEKKFLVRSVIVLALLNIISTGIFLWKGSTCSERPRDSDNYKKEVATILEKELQLTEEQVEQIKKLRAVFSEKEKEISRTIKSKRDSMNAEMFKITTDDSLVIALAKGVADNEYQMELLRFEQSKAFKAICTPGQLEKFDNLVKEIKDYFKPDKPQKKNR